ncbi:hypothetical protein SH528x_002760 [Novipirellula sp. SH528]|uniref:hypothetical protein n=1 Tax=Novipirellula sp. SH528 TaxID=3454466 RepID=UPI003F9ED94F
MRWSKVFALFCLALLGSIAQGATLFQRVTPNERTFTMKDNGNNTFTFTVTRDPAITAPPQDAKYEIRRNGNLRISDGSKTLLSVSVSPSTTMNGMLIYRYTIAKDVAANAVFQLSESWQPKIGLPILGDGHMNLVDKVAFQLSESRRGKSGFGYVTQYGLATAPGFSQNPTPVSTDDRSFDPPPFPSEQGDGG